MVAAEPEWPHRLRRRKQNAQFRVAVRARQIPISHRPIRELARSTPPTRDPTFARLARNQLKHAAPVHAGIWICRHWLRGSLDAVTPSRDRRAREKKGIAVAVRPSEFSVGVDGPGVLGRCRPVSGRNLCSQGWSADRLLGTSRPRQAGIMSPMLQRVGSTATTWSTRNRKPNIDTPNHPRPHTEKNIDQAISALQPCSEQWRVPDSFGAHLNSRCPAHASNVVAVHGRCTIHSTFRPNRRPALISRGQLPISEEGSTEISETRRPSGVRGPRGKISNPNR